METCTSDSCVHPRGCIYLVCPSSSPGDTLSEKHAPVSLSVLLLRGTWIIFGWGLTGRELWWAVWFFWGTFLGHPYLGALGGCMHASASVVSAPPVELPSSRSRSRRRVWGQMHSSILTWWPRATNSKDFWVPGLTCGRGTEQGNAGPTAPICRCLLGAGRLELSNALVYPSHQSHCPHSTEEETVTKTM